MGIQERRAREHLTVFVLLALTSINLAYQLRVQRTGGTVVSDLTPGDVLSPVPVLVSEEGGWVPGQLTPPGPTCQLLVAFDPECPFCRRAAERESAGSVTDRPPTTWFARADTSAVRPYRASVHETSRVVQATGAWEALRIRAVPAAILVDRDRRVVGVWAYDGREPGQYLNDACLEA